MTIRTALAGLLFVTAAIPAGSRAQAAALKNEITALHRDMMAAFTQDPGSVARYYTDDAKIRGGGGRTEGGSDGILRFYVDIYVRAAAGPMMRPGGAP